MKSMKNARRVTTRYENQLLKSKTCNISKEGDCVRLTKDGCIYGRNGKKYFSEVDGAVYPLTVTMWLHVLTQMMAKSMRKNFGNFGKVKAE